MSNEMKLYTVLSYCLIPIALFFAFLDIIILATSLANPSALIMVFIVACLVIYTYTSFKFLKTGVEREQIQTKKTKDWIKVNAYVSLFLCSLFFINLSYAFSYRWKIYLFASLSICNFKWFKN